MSSQPADIVAEIRRLYYETSRGSIERDLLRAISLFKLLPTEEDRERAAVFMDGLSQMRSEWAVARPENPGNNRRAL